jgi:hypothetical protein
MFELAQDYGIYDEVKDVAKYNLVDPAVKNTVVVPRLGWVALRFIADNPGTHTQTMVKHFLKERLDDTTACKM